MNGTTLIVDDDIVFCEVLATALKNRDYQSKQANDFKQAQALIQDWQPDYAIVDLRIGSDSGLKVCEMLLHKYPDIRIVILTGFASIATAVEAIKLGVMQYLTKPTDLDTIINALKQDQADTEIEISTTPLSVKRLEWEHLQKVLTENNGNITNAAKQLNMHRRTLQRKLQKKPVKR
ncbi:MAG TPA: response regulator [Oceanospirillales bacterium]|nr:response regulator [Oceanospirillales bacterium]